VLDKDKRDLAVRLYQEKNTSLARICTMLGSFKPTLYAYVRAAKVAGGNYGEWWSRLFA
jgi:hypothetical protein